jgi:hypothetical protein
LPLFGRAAAAHPPNADSVGDLAAQIKEAREAFSGAAQTFRELAKKIGDEGLRERCLSAPRVRRVLGRD